MKNAEYILKKLDYLPRWAWYLLSMSVAGFVGPFIVHLIFHVLTKAAQDERKDSAWQVDIDVGNRHIHKQGSSWHIDVGDRHIHNQGSSRREVPSMSDDEINRLWNRIEASARKTEAQPDPVDDDAAAVIREGRSVLRRIRHANDLIPDPALSELIDSIESSCAQIFSILEQRPEVLPELRTFLRYYLPTTLRLLDARAHLENSANTPKAREVRQRTSDALAVIDKAFLKQVEALDAYRFIDLESEMDVLKDMLRSDGLLENDDDIPFAAN